MPSMKYCFASLAVGAGIWIPGYYRIPLVLLMAGFLCAICIAVLVLDRQMGIRLPLDVAGVRTDSEALMAPVRAVILGDGPQVEALAESLASSQAYRLLGVIGTRQVTDRCPFLGRPDNVEAYIRELGVEEVFTAPSPTWEEDVAARLAGDDPGFSVRMVCSPAASLLDFGRLGNRGDIAVVPVGITVSVLRELVKRSMDVTIAGVILFLAAPYLLVFGALIRMGSRGPAIFKQERVGRHGRVFTLYKFRTMVEDAEVATGPVLSAGQTDDRLTPLGRVLREYRLDEIPQFWNVFKGDMSLVGPRPERPCFVAQYVQTIPGYAARHLVRPGITGLAQVYGDYHTTPRNKLRFDLVYVARQSLALDLQVLIQTVSVVLSPTRKL